MKEITNVPKPKVDFYTIDAQYFYNKTHQIIIHYQHLLPYPDKTFVQADWS